MINCQPTFTGRALQEHNSAQLDVLSAYLDRAFECIFDGKYDEAIQICNTAREMFSLVFAGSIPEALLQDIEVTKERTKMMKKHADLGLSVIELPLFITLGESKISVESALLDPTIETQEVIEAVMSQLRQP